ncbi:hypothetical protein [Paractinoplanes lichenicola]|uniref:Integral membrane protein n=1 Tax=Paractinoplanes lichenicola TaxID=2802976 RepID=A0ABS1W0M1_9ACTN|nr:hypothetical protein [Actinoplanes lichenicola]MBL7260286.1 hypothetical protein [Actinoplanes lichenicola]
MAGYVRDKSAEWIELRVHGVSGTPPQSMLEHPEVRRVAGDSSSGFYRRVWPTEPGADTKVDTLEAYSWGGLTSGPKLRALWLLLIPFLLVNVAFYARPAGGGRRLRAFADLVQRLFALTITATLVMALVNVTMDFGGWQCGDSCRTSWLGFLSWSWLNGPDRRIAVLALIPLAVVGILWRLARRTWCDNETTEVPDAAPTAQDSPLENRQMWNSARPVRRLRAVHISTAICLVGIFALAPFARDWPSLHGDPAAWPKRGSEILLALTLLLALTSLILATLPSMSDRPGAEDAPPVRNELSDGVRSQLIGALPWASLVVVGSALVWLFVARPAVTGTPGNPRTVLPWLSFAINANIAAQIILLVAMAGVLLAVRPKKDSAAPAAWRGFTTLILMLFGSALSGTYAASLVLAVAHLLGKPQQRQEGIDPLVTSLPYFWAAALAVPIAAVALVFGGIGYWNLRRSAGKPPWENVKAAYALDLPSEDKAVNARAGAISRVWATATLEDTVRRITGWFVSVTILLIVAAFAWFVADRTAITDAEALRAVTNVGDWMVGLFAAGLLYVGRQTYQNASTRRLVGVIWDLGTFWPRAVHPLAPPCYAERAVPDLIKRVAFHTATSRVILSCHSQGAVIGAAVVNQLTYEQSSRVALLTYGAPLRRLYARFFPAYFGPAVLERTARLLLRGEPDPGHKNVPWRNLYRNSDPIGGAVFGADPIDVLLLDPIFAKPPGDTAYPATLGHSHYPDDSHWAEVVKMVKANRPLPLPSGRQSDPGGEPAVRPSRVLLITMSVAARRRHQTRLLLYRRLSRD